MKHRAEPARTIAIIGTGLIGASLGLALRKASQRANIVGWDKRKAHARIAKARGALTRIAPSLEAAVAAADITILAVPLRAVIALLPRVLSNARSGGFVLDVAGLKKPVIAAAVRVMKQRPGVVFVGGHPLAGLERAGPEHARHDLFRGRPFALCAPARGREAALRRAAAFVRQLGAWPVRLDANLHDQIVAATSALPQLVASATALAVGKAGARRDKLTGPGYKDVTRLARSPAGLWVHSLLANKRNVRLALIVFEAQVRELRSAIEHGDAAGLGRLLRSAAAARRRLEPR